MSHTLVTFHAHPDDESIVTGGVMALAASEGHRVVLVVATRGELGEVVDGVLTPGEELWERRVAETHRAAEALGVARVEFLGYRDSGMAGEPTNAAPGAFAGADVDEAAARLAAVLEEERADVLTVYDAHGGYGHPDHVQVHRVGHEAARRARTPQVFEATINRDHVLRLLADRPPDALPDGVEEPDPEAMGLGVPEAILTTRVDVRDFVAEKRAAMAAHASQIDDTSFFLALADEQFREAFGWEWFIRRGAEPGIRESSLFAALGGG